MMQLECPKCRGDNTVAPPNTPGVDVRLTQGKRLVREERYAQGLRELEAAIAIDSENFESHFWRGRGPGS